MTTTTSSPDRFGSYLRGQCKKNIPMMAYLAVLGFIGLPLQYLLAMFRGYTDEFGIYRYSQVYTHDLGGIYANAAIGFTPFLWLVATLVLGIAATSYMHNRRAVDLYHALPVTRHQLLLGNTTATFVTVALPMTVNYLITFVLAAIRHGMAPDRTDFRPGAASLDLLGWYVTCFAILAIIQLVATQVGTTFDTFLFTGVFLAALPVIYAAHYLMCSEYLAGYCGSITDGLLCDLSPATLMAGHYLCGAKQDRWFFGGVAAWLVLSVLILLYAMYQYKRRPSERAESHARDGVAVVLFRFIAVFVGGLGFGILFKFITDLPLLPCVALWGVLVYLLIEAILCRGFKGIGKKSLLTGAVMVLLTLGYVLVILGGGLGFTTRVPQANAVESVTLNYRGRYEQYPLYEADSIRESTYPSNTTEYWYYTAEDITLHGEDTVALVTELHRAILAEEGLTRSSALSGDVRTDYAAPVAVPYDGGYRYYHLTYHMKNGTTVQRQYHAVDTGSELYALLEKLEDTAEFRSKADPLYYWVAEENPYPALDVTGITGIKTASVTEPEQLCRIIEALRRDTQNETAAEFYSADRETLCYLYLRSAEPERWQKVPAPKDFYGDCAYAVSSGYTETLALLEELGLLSAIDDSDWEIACIQPWGCELTTAGRILLPTWYGADTENGNLDYYDSVLLTRAEAEKLLAVSHTTHPNNGRDDCLYLLPGYRDAGTGKESYCLPVFVYLSDAAACDIPALDLMIAQYYGDRWMDPEKYGAMTEIDPYGNVICYDAEGNQIAFYDAESGKWLYDDMAPPAVSDSPASIGVIGGADGPTEIFVTEGNG